MNAATVQVKLQNCTSIDEWLGTSSAIKIYPNPNNGNFVIEGEAGMHLLLLNELGQIVRTIYVPSGGDHTITISDLSKGVYFLSGQKDNLLIKQKIIVTH